MFAPTSQKLIQSHINIQFGHKINQEKTPLQIDFLFDIFSQKNQSDRFVLQILLGNTISDNTLMIQLHSKKGNGSELANKIITFLKQNQQYLKLNKQGKVQVKAIGEGEICYLLINSQKFSKPFDQISNTCSQFKQEKAQDTTVGHQIKLQIKSMNDCKYVTKLLNNQGVMRAAFDSLALNFTFNKTPLVEKVLEKILDELQLQNILGPLKSFRNINLSLNFASASQMDKYEKLRNFGKVVNKIETFFFTPIKGQIDDEVNFTYFNPIFSFQGKLVAQEVETLLEALFEQPVKGN